MAHEQNVIACRICMPKCTAQALPSGRCGTAAIFLTSAIDGVVKIEKRKRYEEDEEEDDEEDDEGDEEEDE
jgi:hypothetical protein